MNFSAAKRIGAAFAVAALIIGGCAREPEAPAVMISSVRIDGSSTVYPVSLAVAEAFRAEMGEQSEILVAESGTGGGFVKFCAGEIDIVGASRPILSDEMVACFRGGVRYVEAPIGFDGITIIAHPTNPVQSATVAELQAIWRPEAQGAVTSWNQVNASWPDAPLALFGPGRDSGTFDYFTEAVVGAAEASRNDYTASEDDEVIVNGVAGDPNALGYVGLAYYTRNAGRLRALAVDAGQGPVAPTPETVTSGQYHPLARPIFIYVNADALARPEVAQMAAYFIEHAADLVGEVGYVPLPETAYAAYLERVHTARAGTAFAGASPTGETIDDIIARPLAERTS